MSQGLLCLNISEAPECGCVQPIREREEGPGGRNPVGKAALNGYFKEAHAPRWVVISGCQLMGLLSLVTTVPCQDTHGWLSRPRKVFQCQQLPVSPQSPETGLRVVLGGSGRSRLGMFGVFCREEATWGCFGGFAGKRRDGDIAGQVMRGGRQGYARVWLGGRGCDACCPEDRVPAPPTAAASLQKLKKRFLPSCPLAGRRRDVGVHCV